MARTTLAEQFVVHALATKMVFTDEDSVRTAVRDFQTRQEALMQPHLEAIRALGYSVSPRGDIRYARGDEHDDDIGVITFCETYEIVVRLRSPRATNSAVKEFLMINPKTGAWEQTGIAVAPAPKKS